MLIPILYRTDRFLICEKPRGLLSESPGLPDQLSLQENGRTLYPVHRLDQGTGGVMLLAFDPKTCSALQQLWSAASVTKEYLAVIPFWTGESEGIFQDLLFHDRYKNKSYVVQRSRKGVKPAECFWEHLQSVQTEVGSLSLMKIRLHTGRTHQLRLHMAYTGTPISGDGLYGDGFDAGMHHIDMRNAAFPTMPLAKLLFLRFDSPALKFFDRPVICLRHLWCTDQAWPHHI